MVATVFLVVDGTGDTAQDALDGKTLLQCASTPSLDRLTRQGRLMHLRFDAPEGAGDPDNWAALAGWIPPAALGAGPLLSSALEIPLGPRDLAFAAPLVTGSPEAVTGTAEVLSPSEFDLVEQALRPLWSRRWRWMAEPTAAVLRWTDGAGRWLGCTPPVQAVGQPLASHLPAGDSAEDLARLIWDSVDILDRLPLNARRRGEGRDPLLGVWPWGHGTALISPHPVPAGWSAVASDPAFLGLARAVGMRPVPLDPTSNIEDAGRQRAVLVRECLVRGDHVVWVHLRRQADAIDPQIAEIEAIDRDFLGTLLDSRADHGPVRWRIAWQGPEGTMVLDSGPDEAIPNRLPFDGRGFADCRDSISPRRLWSNS